MIKNETAKKTCYRGTIQKRHEDDSTVMLGNVAMLFIGSFANAGFNIITK